MAAVKPVIYQLLVRYFGNTNPTRHRNGTKQENGCGQFAEINERALAAIRRLGATHVWLTGCLRQATLTDYSAWGMSADDSDVTKGIAGSMYAIRDYYDVCPDYAVNPAERMQEFEALIQRVHAAGMKVLIDLVPNHVARGYHSVVQPEHDFGLGDDTSQFFARDNSYFYLPGQSLRLVHPPGWDPPGVVFDNQFEPEDGGPGRTPKVTGDNCATASPGVDNWYETIKLNYGYNFLDGQSQFQPRPRTWERIDRILAYWQSKGVDGFRCDMAHFVPREAWQYLTSAARAPGRNPECFFLGEAYPSGWPGTPITNPFDLTDAGFDAVYHSPSYDALKRIYQGYGTQDDYDRAVTFLPGRRSAALCYLENHDERRMASPIVRNRPDGGPCGPGDSGFGGAGAGYQLAPLQFLAGEGPVLLYNGQEVGEPGAGAEGFSSDDGRSTTFDYWCQPELARWVNEHAYDGGQLTDEQRALRRFYVDLLTLCQDSAVRGNGYWGLKYFNRPQRFDDCPAELYSFARYQEQAGRLLLVMANFRAGSQLDGRVRIPPELATAVALGPEPAVRLVFDRLGRKDILMAKRQRDSLVREGFYFSLPNQSCCVYLIQ